MTDVRYTTTATPLSTSSSENAGISISTSGKEGGPVQVTLSDGNTVDGDAVLVTVPLGVLKKSMSFVFALTSHILIVFLFLFLLLKTL